MEGEELSRYTAMTAFMVNLDKNDEITVQVN